MANNKNLKKKTTRPSAKKKQIINKKKTLRNSLNKELINLIKEIDDEGMIFLIKQAQIMKHNLEIDKINQKLTELNKKEQQIRGSEPLKKNEVLAFSIEGSEDNSSFIFATGLSRDIFTSDEMNSLITICNAASGSADVPSRLFRWFANNRKDFLIDNSIRDDKNILLKLMNEYINKYYKAGKSS
jgi:hypothetical protein